jgi:hypothetical protein
MELTSNMNTTTSNTMGSSTQQQHDYVADHPGRPMPPPCVPGRTHRAGRGQQTGGRSAPAVVREMAAPGVGQVVTTQQHHPPHVTRSQVANG